MDVFSILPGLMYFKMLRAALEKRNNGVLLYKENATNFFTNNIIRAF